MPTPHEELTEALLRGADELTGAARRLGIDQVTLARWLTCYDTKQAVASMRHQCDLQASIALSRMRLYAIHNLAQLASQTEQHPETARKAAVTLLTAELDGRTATPPGRLEHPDPNRSRPLLPDHHTADDGNPLDPTPSSDAQAGPERAHRPASDAAPAREAAPTPVAAPTPTSQTTPARVEALDCRIEVQDLIASQTAPARVEAPEPPLAPAPHAPDAAAQSPPRPLRALLAEAWDDDAPDDAPADHAPPTAHPRDGPPPTR